MPRKIKMLFIIMAVSLVLSGCSDSAVTAILQPNGSDTAEKAAEEDMKQELEGEWIRYLHHYNGFLNIVDATDTDFDFELEVLAGANIVSIEGRAQLSGNTAFYKLEDPACRLNFEFQQEMINITVNEDEECYVWGMNGTFFDGKYQKGENRIEIDLVQQGILTEKEDELFKSVVGAGYPLFVENMMLVSIEEEEDAFPARVITGFVRGLADSMQAIIMINDEYVYAAVPSSGSSSIQYYTNDSRDKEIMPDTIQHWISNSFPMYEVIYE